MEARRSLGCAVYGRGQNKAAVEKEKEEVTDDFQKLRVVRDILKGTVQCKYSYVRLGLLG